MDCNKVVERLIQVEHSERRLREEIDILLDLFSKIGKSSNLDKTIELILSETQRIIPFDMASVQVLDDMELKVIGGKGFSDVQKVKTMRFPYPVQGSLSTYALDSGIPVLSSDIARDFPKFIQPKGEKQVKAWIGIPLIHFNEKIGLIAMDSLREHGFSEHHLKLAELIATPLATALENGRIHERMFRMAMEDPLTGLGNRYRLDIEGRMLFETAQRKELPVSVAMMDIDHFKEINDSYGHQIGDLILKELADFCKREIRTTDLLVRAGGDEFVFLLLDSSVHEAKTLLKRIFREWVPLKHSKVQKPVTFSVGLSSAVPTPESSLNEFINLADKALYQSKQEGRNRLSLFSKGETLSRTKTV